MLVFMKNQIIIQCLSRSVAKLNAQIPDRYVVVTTNRLMLWMRNLRQGYNFRSLLFIHHDVVI